MQQPVPRGVLSGVAQRGWARVHRPDNDFADIADVVDVTQITTGIAAGRGCSGLPLFLLLLLVLVLVLLV
jgi:hypothetical protein